MADDLIFVKPVTIPAVCDVEDMLRLFRIKKSKFYELVGAGSFDRFEILPRIGKRARWSGVLIAAYFRGELRPAVVPFRKQKKVG